MPFNIVVAWPLDKRKETPPKFGLNVETYDPTHTKKGTKMFLTYTIVVPGISRAVSRRSTMAGEIVR